MSTQRPAKPDPSVHNVVAFPLRGPIRDKMLNPEGLEDSRGEYSPPPNPEENRKFRELITDALRGGPIRHR